MRIRSCLIAIVPALLVLVSSDAVANEQLANGAVEIPYLVGEVEVILDGDGVPHICSRRTTKTSFCAEGYIHARDRFFQMDLTRREVSGDLAELLGHRPKPARAP